VTDKKIIAVVGATGAQGGGLARAILDDPTGRFSVRAITRHPSSAKAQALAERGAEVVAADIDDEASVRHAFAGAYGAYCLTNFWEHLSAEKEEVQAAAMARAARATGAAPCNLVDAGGHADVDGARRRPHADVAGALQGTPR